MNKFFLYFCSRFLTNQKQTIMRVIIQSIRRCHSGPQTT